MQLNLWLAMPACVAVLLILRFMHKTLEYQFIVLAGNNLNDTAWQESVASVTSWVYTCRYLLPVLGGRLACILGHVRVLQIGGAVMLASVLLMTVAIYLDQWRGGSLLSLLACLLMVVCNGLVIPNIMHGVLSNRTQPKYRTALCALIYMSSAAGLYAGVAVSSLPLVLGRHYAIVCGALAAAFLVIALLALPRLTTVHAVEGPEVNALGAADLGPTLSPLTQNRLRRCCMVFGALTPYLLGVCDDRATVFKAEVGFLANASTSRDGVTADGGSGARDMPTATLLAVGLVTVNVLQLVASCLVRRPRRLPIRPRLIVGLVLQAALEFVLAVVSSGGVRFADATSVRTFYAVVSLLDGLNAALVMVAAYELMDGFERDKWRPLIVGVMLTVWGLANVASRLLITLCRNVPPDNPILRPSYSQQPLMFVYHSVLFVLVAGSLVYCRLYVFPLADSLTVNYDSRDERENGATLVLAAAWVDAADNDDEAKPLLSNSRSSEHRFVAY